MSVNEEADGLRPLIVVGACGAFVAVPRNHAEIVLAHANRRHAPHWIDDRMLKAWAQQTPGRRLRTPGY
jgi:hypothetical protein